MYTTNFHNTYVVEQLRAAARFSYESIDEVPHGAVLVFSAHGVPRGFAMKPRPLFESDRFYLPLVTKYIRGPQVRARRPTIILIGHKDHQELSVLPVKRPDRTIVVDSGCRSGKLEVHNPDKLAFLTQTSSACTIRRKSCSPRRSFEIVGPRADDIAMPTQNSQEAVEQVAQMWIDSVVGSQNSSNSTACGSPQRVGHSRTHRFRIGHYRLGSKACEGWLDCRVAPEVLVEQVSQRLAEHGYTDQRNLD